MARISLAPTTDQRLAARQVGFLPREEWDRYQDACRSAGLRYVAAEEAQVGPLEAVPVLVEALEAGGFAVDVAPALADGLKARVARMRDEVGLMRAQVVDLERTLAGRGLKLWRFQSEGVAWLRANPTGILGDDMGLGKTVQGLVAIPDQPPVLVIAPSVAKGVWRNEAKRFRPDLRPAVLAGRGSFRWPWAGEMVITNYDILPVAKGESRGKKKKGPDGRLVAVPPKPHEDPGPCRPGTVIIADEAHALKSASSLRTRRFKALARYAQAAGGRVWLLTGTPLLSEPSELWVLLSIIGRAEECFGNWPTFCHLFGYQVTNGFGGGEWGKPADTVGDRLRRAMLRRKREEVLPDLPTKTWETLEVEDLPASTRAVCDQVLQALNEAGIDLEKALRLTAISADGGNLFQIMSAARKALATAKIPTLLQVVEQHEEAGEPLVVFSAHRDPIDLLGRRDGWATITGDTSPDDRTEITRRFQAGELRGVAITIKAGGVALTLTRAHKAVFVDLEWNPALNAQAEDRICRIGQDRGVVITRLVAAHPLDVRVSEILDRKQRTITGSVDAAVVQVGGFTEAVEREADTLEATLRDLVVATGAASHGGDVAGLRLDDLGDLRLDDLDTPPF